MKVGDRPSSAVGAIERGCQALGLDAFRDMMCGAHPSGFVAGPILRVRP